MTARVRSAALVPPVVLVGPPGAGKTTVGPLVAQELGFSFVDLDVRADAAAFDGTRLSEASFRVREHRALSRVLAEGPVVIAAGAGATDADDNRALLASALVVELRCPPDVCLARLAQEARPRPWLHGDLDARARAYREREAGRAGLRASSAAASVESAGDARSVAEAIGRAVRAARLPTAPDPDVALALDVVGAASGRAFIVADPRVVEAVGHVDLALAVDGTTKRLAVVERVLAALAAGGVRRTDTVVAVGGGVLLDVVGLAAGLHHRGTPWRAVPTTLLAMVDAGLGGKTAVDVVDNDGALTRNGAGLLHPPRSAHVWPGFLATLADDALRHGRAEMLKHALLAGDDDLSCGIDSAAIARSRGYKRAVVERDLHERHLRHSLNLGHTFAHALEAVRGIAHGDAVLYGLRAAAALSECAVGLAAEEGDQVRRAVHALAPPALTLDDEAVDAICGALGRDKKGGRFVLLRRRGEPVLCDVAAVDHADVRAAVRAMTGDTPPG